MAKKTTLSALISFALFGDIEEAALLILYYLLQKAENKRSQCIFEQEKEQFSSCC